jgi:hypothetical protein
VPPDGAVALLEVLLAEGLEADEVRRVLPHLPVEAATVERVAGLLDVAGG